MIVLSPGLAPPLPPYPVQPHPHPLPAVLPGAEVKLGAGVELLQSEHQMSMGQVLVIVTTLPWGREAVDVVVLDELVGVHDDWYEDWEDDVDEEADEGVEVDPTVNPHWSEW